MSQLVVDYAWQHPDPAQIKAAGYLGALRYLSHDPTKNLTVAELQALQAAGLWVGVVWETTAAEATSGVAAGIDDRDAANGLADALGIPAGMPIYFAVDMNATVDQVTPYFQGVQGKRPVGVYGSATIVSGIKAAGLAGFGWQCAAWSGTDVSAVADIYQRVTPTLPMIVGAIGIYDEDLILTTNHGMWLPDISVPDTPSAPPSAPTPPPVDPVEEACMSFPDIGANSPDVHNVKKVQGLLNAFGYGLVADGVDGPHTQWATRNFQENHGLAVDGVCGPLTAAKLIVS